MSTARYNFRVCMVLFPQAVTRHVLQKFAQTYVSVCVISAVAHALECSA
ncbi:hypothetical protein [Prevotella sp. HMSC073D09]|nr:hypothetical protein [Prevotella sp. HMSC073D09]